MINFMSFAEGSDSNSSASSPPPSPKSKPIPKPQEQRTPFENISKSSRSNSTNPSKQAQNDQKQNKKNQKKGKSVKKKRPRVIIDQATGKSDFGLNHKTVEDIRRSLQEKRQNEADQFSKQIEETQKEGPLAALPKGKTSPLRNPKFANKKKFKRKFKKKESKYAKADDHLSKKQRFEKKGNFQKLNMKRGYQERLTGKAYIYKTRYLANGRSKAFYKNLDKKQNKTDNDPKSAKEVEEAYEYKAKVKMDITAMVDVYSRTSVITEDNVFYKMINEGMMLFMFERSNIPENLRQTYDARMVECQGEGVGEDVDGSWVKNLRRVFGHEDFYDFQREILKKTYNGVSSLVDFYTGAGKSLIFQFYSMLRPGMTIVLVPLISLMVDQVKKIPKEIPAMCYNSWVPFTQRGRVFRLIREGKIKILFVTPELFVSDIAWRLVRFGTKINLICIDEAHCVSESSHSFRHSYSFLKDYVNLLNNRDKIYMGDKLFEITEKGDEKKKGKKGKMDEEVDEAELDQMLFARRKKDQEQKMEEEENEESKEQLEKKENSNKFPILSLTATSSAQSRRDIIDYFNLDQDNVKYSNYYLRQNLIVTVSLERTRVKELHKLLRLKSMRGKKPLLVYCNFIRTIEPVANYLKQNGINAVSFNSSLTQLERLNVLQQFLSTDPEQNNKTKEQREMDLGLYKPIDAIVTTVSLAMGIDHRSIRGVIHYNMPNSLETYVQEVGRAGRDGLPAHCHLFLNEDDYYFQRARAFTDHFIDRETTKILVRLVLGTRHEIKQLQSGEISKKWDFVKIDRIRARYGITQKEFLNLMKHIKVYMDMHGVEWEYSERLKVRGLIKNLKPTNMKLYNSHPLIKDIKASSEKVRRVHAFDIVKFANERQINPFLFDTRMKDFANQLKFSYITDHPAYLFTRPKLAEGQNIKDILNVNKITEFIIKRNLEMIRVHASRVDALYMVLRDHGKKGIDSFIDDDLKADKNSKMEKYVKIYFNEGPSQMLEQLRLDGSRPVPILGIEADRNSHEYLELKDSMAKFFREQTRVTLLVKLFRN